MYRYLSRRNREHRKHHPRWSFGQRLLARNRSFDLVLTVHGCYLVVFTSLGGCPCCLPMPCENRYEAALFARQHIRIMKGSGLAHPC